MPPLSFWIHFESLKGPRVQRTRRHELMEVVIISVMAVICYADGWDDIAEFAKARESWLRTFLELPHGIPCADTYRRVFTALDPGAFQGCFMNGVRSVIGTTEGKLVAIDGKTVRHSFAGEEGREPQHLVSAWVAQNQLVLHPGAAGRGTGPGLICEARSAMPLQGTKHATCRTLWPMRSHA
jgi:hypothetical protein